MLAAVFHYENIPWNYIVYHGITWHFVILHGKLWCTMVYLFQNTMAFYHGFPVSKHHGILPWLPCFKTPWHFTMAYLFQNTMEYHGIYHGTFS